jgi:hypothetical protein
MGPELAEQYRMVSGLEEFATEYDRALYGARYGSFGVEGLLNADAANAYDPAKIAAANQVIRENWSQTDDNPLYSFIEGGTFSPIIGPGAVVSLTTRAFYEENNPRLIALGIAGGPHGQSRGGIAADIGTKGNNFPIAFTQPETMLAQDSSLLFADGGGLTAITQTDEFSFRYAHMQNNTYAYYKLNRLLNQTMYSEMFRVTLPAGYQIGNVGNTGRLTTSEHLHWEWIPW